MTITELLAEMKRENKKHYYPETDRLITALEKAVEQRDNYQFQINGSGDIQKGMQDIDNDEISKILKGKE